MRSRHAPITGLSPGSATNGLTPAARFFSSSRTGSGFCSSLIFGAAGGAYLEALAVVEDTTPEGQVKIAAKALDVPLANAPANALVIGYDHRPEDGTAPSRSDTIMLLRADPDAKTITSLSFPLTRLAPLRAAPLLCLRRR